MGQQQSKDESQDDRLNQYLIYTDGEELMKRESAYQNRHRETNSLSFDDEQRAFDSVHEHRRNSDSAANVHPLPMTMTCHDILNPLGIFAEGLEKFRPVNSRPFSINPELLLELTNVQQFPRVQDHSPPKSAFVPCSGPPSRVPLFFPLKKTNAPICHANQTPHVSTTITSSTPYSNSNTIEENKSLPLSSFSGITFPTTASHCIDSARPIKPPAFHLSDSEVMKLKLPELSLLPVAAEEPIPVDTSLPISNTTHQEYEIGDRIIREKYSGPFELGANHDHETFQTYQIKNDFPQHEAGVKNDDNSAVLDRMPHLMRSQSALSLDEFLVSNASMMLSPTEADTFESDGTPLYAPKSRKFMSKKQMEFLNKTSSPNQNGRDTVENGNSKEEMRRLLHGLPPSGAKKKAQAKSDTNAKTAVNCSSGTSNAKCSSSHQHTHSNNTSSHTTHEKQDDAACSRTNMAQQGRLDKLRKLQQAHVDDIFVCFFCEYDMFYRKKAKKRSHQKKKYRVTPVPIPP